MPASRSAKEICREDPTSISCKVATQREARKKKFEEQYAEEPAETEVEEAEETEVEETETEAPKPATERLKYLDELEKAAGSK